jgi:nicotinamide-nucleotide amidase
VLAEEIVSELLKRTGLTLATAESLTGGIVGQMITSVPGASSFYLGGMITYATRVKSAVLGVSDETLRTSGPVSCQTACEMASRARAVFDASIGLSTTGVAGPTTQDGHPVGTLFVGISIGDGTRCVQMSGPEGDRREVREWAARKALGVLVQALRLSVA